MTKEEAEKFLVFQKHYDFFLQLDQHRIFDINFGKVTLNFAFKTLQNIVKEEMVYRKLDK